MENKKQELKVELDEKYQELEEIVKSNNDLEPRAKSIAITNLQTSKMWVVKAIFE